MGSGHTVHEMRTRRGRGWAATVRRVTDQPVLDIPQEREIRDELQRLVLADLHGPDGRVVGPVVGHDDQDEEAGQREVCSGEFIEMLRPQLGTANARPGRPPGGETRT